MLMVGMTCAKNAAVPLVFAEGVDVTFIYEPIAGCDISLPPASPGVTAGATGRGGGKMPSTAGSALLPVEVSVTIVRCHVLPVARSVEPLW